jgi:hypothetical protein
MTEREKLIIEIARLEARRTALMADEIRLHTAFMKESDETKANRIAAYLQDVCGALDKIGGKLGIAKAQLYDIEAGISLREKVADAAYGRSL